MEIVQSDTRQATVAKNVQMSFTDWGRISARDWSDWCRWRAWRNSSGCREHLRGIVVGNQDPAKIFTAWPPIWFCSTRVADWYDSSANWPKRNAISFNLLLWLTSCSKIAAKPVGSTLDCLHICWFSLEFNLTVCPRIDRISEWWWNYDGTLSATRHRHHNTSDMVNAVQWLYTSFPPSELLRNVSFPGTRNWMEWTGHDTRSTMAEQPRCLGKTKSNQFV